MPYLELLLLVLATTVQAETLCSLPPVVYTTAKVAYPAAAFAIEALEQNNIATWYSDQLKSGDYAQLATDLVSLCPEDSRLSVVVYGLPEKDCNLKTPTDRTVHTAADYVAFLTKLTTTIGKRKVLYILEPDAIGLLTDASSCGHKAGYLANLQTAVGLLSQNDNAMIYLEVGYWTLESPATATNVATLVKQLTTPGSRVKGITLNTLNYQSINTLSTLCTTFQNAMGSTDLHCVIDTSRNRNDKPPNHEWCNVQTTGIGALPTDQTGYANVDYFVWATPPGTSDGTCRHRRSNSMAGPPPGEFFPAFFQSLWNQSLLVAEKKYPPISGTLIESDETLADENDATDTRPRLHAANDAYIDDDTLHSATALQVSGENSSKNTRGTGVVAIVALVGVAVVAVGAVVNWRRKEGKLKVARETALSALAPLPNFPPRERDSLSIL
ncbi:hypothetical protein CCR75_001105 [Bremia lactucae]|uniref:Glycoside hydrolase n=1 Tax=Bremia lactucae TaxID=4779 RepID=A0A976FRK5_BRELC|nr:hypothetical protein CCR75_001105 [Bremia lactucae]